MGEGSEWTAASGGGTREAHDVGISPQEDRGGTAGAVGEGEDWEEVRMRRLSLFKSIAHGRAFGYGAIRGLEKRGRK
jgi:hypothetical protein